MRVLDESEFGVFRVVLLAVNCGFDAFRLLGSRSDYASLKIVI